MKYLITLLILLITAVTVIGLYLTSPKIEKKVPERPVPLVRTSAINTVREQVFIEAFGTVVPAKRITLQSEVEGRIIKQNTALVPGGLIDRGDVIIQIDPSDYKLQVNQYRSEMEEVIYELDLEQGKQVIAEREWRLMEEEIDSTEVGKSLALREPHLRLVKARVEKAKSRLAVAELALERTTIRAPFNALVLEEFTDEGQLVNRQTPLATLAGADQFRVQVSVPVAALQRISVPEGPGKAGSEAEVIFEPVSGSAVIRHGQVLQVMGDLDPEGRMARILIVIEDPLNLQAGQQAEGEKMQRMERLKPGGVLLGSYVKVRISAGFLDNVYAIPRQALREGDVIWVKDSEDTLRVRTVRVVWRKRDEVLVDADLEPGDLLILSRLQSPMPGMRVSGAE
jgi:RND family efflux transporter MFP subunit